MTVLLAAGMLQRWEMREQGGGGGLCGRLVRPVGLGLKAVQVVGGPLRVAGGAEDEPLVVLQHLEPVADVGGVILPDVRGDAEVGRQEGGTEFGDKFLAGVAFVAPCFPAEVAVEALRVPRPVRLMPISA